MCGFTYVNKEYLNQYIYNEYYNYDHYHIIQPPCRSNIYEKLQELKRQITVKKYSKNKLNRFILKRGCVIIILDNITDIDYTNI